MELLASDVMKLMEYLEIEKAQAENLDPVNAQIASDDIDVAHIDEHQRALLELQPATPESNEATEAKVTEEQAPAPEAKVH